MKAFRKFSALSLALTLLVGSLSPALAVGVDNTQWYYSQLTEAEKTVYNSLYSAVDEVRTQVSFRTKSELGKDSLSRVFRALSFEQPYKFWLGGWSVQNQQPEADNFRSVLIPSIIAPYGSMPEGDYLPGTPNTQLISQTRATAEKVAQQIVTDATGSTYQKLSAFNAQLIARSDYDETEGKNDKRPYSMPGALVDGSAVCQGYALAFQYLCQLAGIPCVFVPGTAYSSQKGGYISHAWNYVKLGDAWYHVDVTFNDPIGQQTPEDATRFFLLGASSMVDGQRISALYRPDPQGFTLPTLSSTAYTVK